MLNTKSSTWFVNVPHNSESTLVSSISSKGFSRESYYYFSESNTNIYYHNIIVLLLCVIGGPFWFNFGPKFLISALISCNCSENEGTLNTFNTLLVKFCAKNVGNDKSWIP